MIRVNALHVAYYDYCHYSHGYTYKYIYYTHALRIIPNHVRLPRKITHHDKI
jgi:hypothetical protein